MEREQGAPATSPVAKTSQDVLAAHFASQGWTPPAADVPPASSPASPVTPPPAPTSDGTTPPGTPAEPGKVDTPTPIAELLWAPPPPEKKQFVPLERLQDVISKGKTRETELQAQVEHWKAKAVARAETVKNLPDDQKQELERTKALGIKNVDIEIEENLSTLEWELKKETDAVSQAQTELNEGTGKWFDERVGQLTTKFDWNNGLPKFDLAELREFANASNFFPEDPLILYQQKHLDAIIKFAASQQGKPATKIEPGTPGQATVVVPPSYNYSDKSARTNHANAVLEKFKANYAS